MNIWFLMQKAELKVEKLVLCYVICMQRIYAKKSIIGNKYAKSSDFYG